MVINVGVMYELEEMLVYLKVHGHEIGKGARDGDKVCRDVVAAYTLVHKRAEPGAIGVLGAALERYQRQTHSAALTQDSGEQEADND